MVHLLLLALVTEEVAEVPVIVLVVVAIVVVIVVGAMRVVDMMVAVGVVVVALMVVIVNKGVMVLMVRVLRLLWRLFHPMMVLAVTLHPWGMEWKQFLRLQAMQGVHLRMVVPQGVMAVMHRALVVGVVEVVDMMVVEVVATMVVVLLDARNLAMEMHLLKKSSSATRIVMKLVIMPEYTSLIYLRM